MAINFEWLQSELIQYVRASIRKGEVTERALARASGISQPHLHNVLKGKRALSLEKADRILAYFELDLNFLLEHHGGPDGDF